MIRQVRLWGSMFLAGVLAGGTTLDAKSPQDPQPQIKTWKEFRKKELGERKAEKMKFRDERKSALKKAQKARRGITTDRRELRLKQRADRKTDMRKQQKERKALAKERDRLKERKLIRQKRRERV